MSKVLGSVALVLALSAGNAFADGQVSKSTLSSFGLSSMQVMSDANGMQIRGSGGYGRSRGSASAWVSGYSYSSFFGNTGEHGYEAHSQRSSHAVAKGSSYSVSGGVIFGLGAGLAGSAGGAKAYAK